MEPPRGHDMKMTILGLAVAVALVAVIGGAPPAATATQPKAEAKPEALPEYPLLDPKNKIVFLSPDKQLVAEVSGEGKDKKVVRVGIVAEDCVREGPLELLLCKKGTEELEATVHVVHDVVLIH